MATRPEFEQAILDRMAELAVTASSTTALKLAEAYAWLVNPNQPHGGHAEISGK